MLGAALLARRDLVGPDVVLPKMELDIVETTTTIPGLPLGAPADAVGNAASRATTTTPPPPAPTTPPTTSKRAAPAIPRMPIGLGDCPTSGWGVKPAVAQAGHSIAGVFGLAESSIIGLGSRGNASDHPYGLALDFMTSSSRAGDEIAAYVLEHRSELGVTYVIWKQRINTGTGWVPMENRGSITANHYDHVHVSFSAAGGTGTTC